ncbi:MAG: DNA repair ATPase [Myxococcota bacterium]|nr:DNA repair ATPase [Myxococcota bacterium]
MDDSSTPAGEALGDSYQVLKSRLEKYAQDLGAKVQKVNQLRESTFGASRFELLKRQKIRTHNKCIPIDILNINGNLLFGYNVYVALRQHIEITDTFGLYHFEESEKGFEFSRIEEGEPLAFLQDQQFVRDYTNLLNFNRRAKLIQFRIIGSKILAIFQTGASHREFKAFRWTYDGFSHPVYKDEFGQEDHVFPISHDFDWIETTSEDQVRGEHPHMNIQDQIFVETVGGDLTIKIENNTADGEGIYSEPVEDLNQTLDDGKIAYAFVGQLILLRIVPRMEEPRYFVFNSLTHEVTRVDAIGLSCIQLPEDHGVIFPGGYVLAEGGSRLFNFDTTDLEYKTRIDAPNGEDVLFVYLRRSDGCYLLLPYNIVNKEVKTPIYCNGYSIFEDGKLVFFQAKEEPQSVHEMQIWDTPFMSEEYAAEAKEREDGSFLQDIGNAELVRAISDVNSLRQFIGNPEPTAKLYENLVRSCERMHQNYSWLEHPDVGNLRETTEQLRLTAEQIIDEFDKVAAQKKRAIQQLKEARKGVNAILSSLRPERFRRIEEYMSGMATLDKESSSVRGLQDVKYMNVEGVQALSQKLDERMQSLCQRCASFLQKDEAFKPLQKSLEDMARKIEDLKKSKEVNPLLERLDSLMDGLDVLLDAKERLQVDDAELQLKINYNIQDVQRKSNQVKIALDKKAKDIRFVEATAQFSTELQLFDLSLESGSARAETPEQCDEELSRLSGMLDDLDARFGDIDEFVDQIDEKRELLQSNLFSRKQQLLEKRQQRVARLFGNAEQIIQGLSERKFDDMGSLRNFFATDRRVQRVRKLAGQISEFKEPNKSEELLSRLKSTEQDALRKLRDASELFEAGSNLIKFGSHRFAINTQPFEMTIAPYQDGVAVHITNTDFHEPIQDPEYLATQKYWGQSVVSENETVYRGEYLAASLLFAAETGTDGLSIAKLESAADLGSVVDSFASKTPNAGYVKGVHDADAVEILRALLRLRKDAGRLRFPARPRAAAVWWWTSLSDKDRIERWKKQALSFSMMKKSLGAGSSLGFAREISNHIRDYLQEHRILPDLTEHELELAGVYLSEEIAQKVPKFVLSAAAAEVDTLFKNRLRKTAALNEFSRDVRALTEDRFAQYQLVTAWVAAAIDSLSPTNPHIAAELVAYLCTDSSLWQVHTVNIRATIESLQGQHKRIKDSKLDIRYDEFLERLRYFHRVDVPGFRRYREMRRVFIQKQDKRLRLDELRPRVLTSFVRNKLINDVYLHLIGDNLAKQIGAAGAKKRTDLMGMLLLISPPGYGKTTLMEYVASRMGMAFVKVNGPSLGHDVVSLDPTESPNATARQEVEKINLSFEMANNVMLYLDDIQHTNPEFLQKFISLCDGQRRIEGVWNGRTRTYDLRGKRFCVIMAGNPYTETGEKFTIPDMLANRADIYNLGDELSGKEHLFALSYIENSLTSNSTLAPLSSREQKDLYLFVRMAEGEEVSASELSHDYSTAEREDIVKTLQKMMMCRDVLLKVNSEYIFSAAQDDRLRTEPPFKLQGSYRNMNKLSEKIVPAMNDSEVLSLITDHYKGESQTLTTGARANLLKLQALRGILSEADEKEWARIRDEFVTIRRMGGTGDDPVARMTGSLSLISDQLKDIPKSLRASQDSLSEHLKEIPHAFKDSHHTLSNHLLNIPAALESSKKVLSEHLAEIPEAVKQAGDPEISKQLTHVSAQLSALKESLDDTQILERGFISLRKDLQSISGTLQQPSSTLPPLQNMQQAIVQLYNLMSSDSTAEALRSLKDTLETRVEEERLSVLTHSLQQINSTLIGLQGGTAVPPATNGDVIVERTHKILLEEAQRSFAGLPARPSADPTLAGALEAIQTLTERISQRLSHITKPEFRDRILKLIQEDVAKALVEIAENRKSKPE